MLVVEDTVRIDAEQVKNGSDPDRVAAADRVRERRSKSIARAKHLAPRDAGACQREAEDAAPVIAPAQAVDARRAAELADRHNKCFIQ